MPEIRFKPGRKDLILIAAVFLIAAAAALIIYGPAARKGRTVRITADGKTYGCYSLDEDRTVKVTTSDGFNEIEIKDGKVSVKDADCPQGICVRHSPVYRAGESIICLPHNVIITIEGETGEEEADAVSG